jgi:hypothetical protein
MCSDCLEQQFARLAVVEVPSVVENGVLFLAAKGKP